MRSTPLLLLAPAVLSGCMLDPGGPPTGSARVVWEVQGTGWNVAPDTDASTVYFGGKNHELFAVDRATGTLRWRSRTPLETSFTEGMGVAVAGNVAVLADAFLFAFDRTTGALAWTFRPADDDMLGLLTIVSDGATIYAPSNRDRVYAVNAADGTQRWMTQLPGDDVTAAMRPIYAAGRVFVGVKRFGLPTSGALVALDAADGQVLWRHDFTPAYANALYGCLGYSVYADGTVYTAAEDGRIYAFDGATGAVRWTAPFVHALPPAPLGMYADTRPLALAGNVLVAGSLSGIVVGLDATTGAERWRHAGLIYPQGTYIGADAGTVYITETGGELHAIDAGSGIDRWRFGRPGNDNVLTYSVASNALPAGGLVFAAGYERLLALRKD